MMLSKPRAGHPQDLLLAYDADGDDAAVDDAGDTADGDDAMWC